VEHSCFPIPIAIGRAVFPARPAGGDFGALFLVLFWRSKKEQLEIKLLLFILMSFVNVYFFLSREKEKKKRHFLFTEN
jgi:hypothetical protein